MNFMPCALKVLNVHAGVESGCILHKDTPAATVSVSC